MEPVKENEKKPLMREEENQEYSVLGAKDQELPRDLAMGRSLVSLAAAVLVE